MFVKVIKGVLASILALFIVGVSENLYTYSAYGGLGASITSNGLVILVHLGGIAILALLIYAIIKYKV